ncbi:MAG TPA: cupredoxin family copper-binding protein [Chitinophagaceae bacterium]|nr:cupredoxin family copper-binding protein [Chitinophagaceae bacterium]
MKNKIVQQGLFTSLLFIMLFTACKKDNNNDYNGGNNNGGGNTKDSNTVTIADFKFSPLSLTVKPGTTVTWTNNDSAPHTVTADDGSFTSATLNKGNTYAHTFSAAGTVAYHCNFHTTMKASVVVQ